jgi:hypothetical protein
VRLTGLDTAFLSLDRDVFPMHLGALATFRPVHLGDPGRVAALLAERAQRLPQLRRRVQLSGFPLPAASWEGDLESVPRTPHPRAYLGCHGSLGCAAHTCRLRPPRW